MGVSLGFGQTPRPEAAPAAWVERAYRETKARFEQQPTNAVAAWQFARACFDRAELAEQDSARAEAAQEGLQASRKAIQADPKLAPAHYYLAMNLGQLARTRGLSALKLLEEVESAFLSALRLDPAFDHAGPHRSLGLLYRDAPGWPLSLGDRAKARQHLRKAVDLSPGYPDNRLALLEAYLNWGEKSAAEKDLKATEEALQAARGQFTGDAWTASWQDWDRRWERLKARVGAPKVRSPRSRE